MAMAKAQNSFAPQNSAYQTMQAKQQQQ
jgi:hypothetical protein